MYIMDLTQALSFRLAKEMFLIGLEVQFTTNLRITQDGVRVVHLELLKTTASELGLTEKINIALENVIQFM